MSGSLIASGLIDNVKGKNVVKAPLFLLQASLLVGAVEAWVSSGKEKPVGLVGAFVKAVNYNWWVMQRAAIDDKIIYHPHLLLLP